jgi:hypothetical protein
MLTSPYPSHIDPAFEADNRPRPKVKIAFYLKREVFFHVTNTFIPMHLLTAMTMASFVVPSVEQTGDKIAVSLWWSLFQHLFIWGGGVHICILLPRCV